MQYEFSPSSSVLLLRNFLGKHYTRNNSDFEEIKLSAFSRPDQTWLEQLAIAQKGIEFNGTEIFKDFMKSAPTLNK